MASRIIVAPVRSLVPSAETVTTEGRTTSGVEVQFETGESATLAPTDPRLSGRAEIIEGARRLSIPLYVEVDDATRHITNIDIPLVSTVAGITVAPSGDVEVEFDASHARHTLKRSNTSYDAILQILRAARANGGWVAAKETDDNEIIDARPTQRPTIGAEEAAPTAEAAPDTVTPAKAKELFDAMKARSCGGSNPTPQCIPFTFPDDGCWVRAHEMARLMKAMGANPQKPSGKPPREMPPRACRIRAPPCSIDKDNPPCQQTNWTSRSSN
jgi:hypothetical protein